MGEEEGTECRVWNVAVHILLSSSHSYEIVYIFKKCLIVPDEILILANMSLNLAKFLHVGAGAQLRITRWRKGHFKRFRKGRVSVRFSNFSIPCPPP